MNCCDYNCNQGRDCPVRRYPRTMRQAFGPDTDDRLEPMPEPRPRWGGLAFGVLCLGFSILLFKVVSTCA